MSEAESFVVVHTGSATDVGRVKSLLESAGINAFMTGENLASIEVGVVGAGGMGLATVEVARRDLEAAKKLIEDHIG